MLNLIQGVARPTPLYTFGVIYLTSERQFFKLCLNKACPALHTPLSKRAFLTMEVEKDLTMPSKIPQVGSPQPLDHSIQQQ